MKSVFLMSLLVVSTVFSSFFNTGFRLQVVYTHVSTCFHQLHVGRILQNSTSPDSQKSFRNCSDFYFWLSHQFCIFLQTSLASQASASTRLLCFGGWMRVFVKWQGGQTRPSHDTSSFGGCTTTRKKNGKANVMHLKHLCIIMLHIKIPNGSRSSAGSKTQLSIEACPFFFTTDKKAQTKKKTDLCSEKCWEQLNFLAVQPHAAAANHVFQWSLMNIKTANYMTLTSHISSCLLIPLCLDQVRASLCS